MYLGLDLGTSGLRGLLVSEAGVPVGDHAASYPVSCPHEGWSEQDPADWLMACHAVTAQLRQTYPKEFAAIRGIGVAGHMHGATLLDVSGQVIRPCILWNDGRAAEEAATLDAIPVFRELSGNIVFPGFTAPKLMWVARHEPEAFARIHKVLLPKDYLVYWLTGRFVSDLSDAAGTSWLDVAHRCWSDELIDKSGMGREQMPDLVEGSEVVGQLDARVASELGLSGQVKVVGGGGDNAAAACGIGALQDNQGFLSLGTSGVLLAAKNRYAPAPDSAVHTFCHAIPDKWYQMGVILSATDSLNWLANNVGKTAEALSSELPERSDGPSALLFLPYLSGERTPHNEVKPRGSFLGLARGTDTTALCQSVMEGVSFAMRDCYEALRSTGTELTDLLAIGGGSQSGFWLQTMADTLGIPLHLPGKGDFGAAMGAARLAMTGVEGQSPESVMLPPPIECTFEPRMNLRDAYEASYLRYTKSYSALKEVL